MEKENFYKKLITLVLPIAMQNLMTALVGASDVFMLGASSQNALSSVSLATQIQFVLNLFYAALTIGTTVLAAQYWGKGDKEAVERILAVALKISVLISSLFFLAVILFPEVLMRVFTNEKMLIEMGTSYLKIVGWSYLCTGISQIYLCIMKNSGRTFKSTVYGSASVVLNVILNAVLIFGLFGFPEMEIEGAAVATVIARVVELVLVVMENLRNVRCFRRESGRDEQEVCIRWKYLIGNTSNLRTDFYKYTLPVLANELFWGCGFAMFSVIMGHLGSDAVAANSIANIVKNIAACLCMGIGAGSGIIVGNELGVGNLEKAREYGKKLCRISLAAGIISGVLLLMCKPMLMLYAEDLSVRAAEYLKEMLLVCAYYMIGKSINSTVIAGIFCAGGDTKFGLVCDAVTMWMVIVPLGMISAFIWKLPVLLVYFLLNLDEFIKLPVVYRHYKKYGWVKNLTDK